MKKITIIILTWQRLTNLGSILSELSNQTYKDFEVRVSNGNLKRVGTVEKYVSSFKNKLSISVSHDGNDQKAFRRLIIGKEVAKSGTDVVMFIDDDVSIPNNYIENCLSQYEDKSYKSAYSWFFTNPKNYYKSRVRVVSDTQPVHYGGTGLAMVDAKIFLEDGLLSPPDGGKLIEDLWLSYYADHVMKWKVSWIKDTNTTVYGLDGFALSKIVKNSECNKDDFLADLTSNFGWDITLPKA
jgi:glycosyltransferase involved in cell wall biosynthesis